MWSCRGRRGRPSAQHSLNTGPSGVCTMYPATPRGYSDGAWPGTSTGSHCGTPVLIVCADGANRGEHRSATRAVRLVSVGYSNQLTLNRTAALLAAPALAHLLVANNGLATLVSSSSEIAPSIRWKNVEEYGRSRCCWVNSILKVDCMSRRSSSSSYAHSSSRCVRGSRKGQVVSGNCCLVWPRATM